MRLLRLRLANYRGIDESEVRFGPQGLTIVEGPNEAGKTCLSEAIRILFDYLDSSKHSEVKAIKPVTRDVGPEIELEAESGPYVFTYFKRFSFWGHILICELIESRLLCQFLSSLNWLFALLTI